MGQSCGMIGVLSCSLSSKQLLLLLKASIRPLVQVNKLGGFLEEPKAGKTGSNLPESTYNRAYATMIPMPSAESIRSEKPNSLTRLLVATLAFKILHKFMNGTTQWKMQEKYNLRPKQLALYLMGRRYLGGSDWKRRVSESNKEPSTSKKLKSQWTNYSHLADKKSARWVMGSSVSEDTHHSPHLIYHPRTASHLHHHLIILQVLQSIVPAQVTIKWDSNTTAPCNHP